MLYYSLNVRKDTNNSIFRQKKSAPTVKQVREIGDSCQILETGTGISKTLSTKKYRNPLKDCGMYEAVSLVFVRRGFAPAAIPIRSINPPYRGKNAKTPLISPHEFVNGEIILYKTVE